MKKETLMDAVGGVEERLVEEANEPKKKERHWGRWVALAACLAIVVTAVGLFPRMGGNAGPTGTSGRPRTYHGPLLPLTALSGGMGLTADRALTLDLAERGDYRSGHAALVSDCYTLTNPTNEDVTVEVAYPFITSLNDLREADVSLWVDGERADAALLAGGYTGGFQGAGSEEGTLNLDGADSFEDYQTLLTSSYLFEAMEGGPDLSATPVTVYKFTEAWYEGEGTNPSLRAEFHMDNAKTTLLTYGFHSGKYRGPEELSGRGFSIREEHEPGYGEPYYLIVVGEDIRGLTTSVYETGGWDTTAQMDGGVTVERYETDLEAALWEAFGLMCEFDSWKTALGVTVEREDREQWFRLFCDHLVSYGVLAENGAERYYAGMLEDLDFLIVSRVFWLRTEITVPAGGSVEVEARMRKPAGATYPGAAANYYSYELATTLGSTLHLSSQRLTVINAGGLTLTDNGGLDLDPAAGANMALLDPGVGCYELKIEGTY